uniref:Craniofacial development protein 2-like n=1 Tax=Nicotiana tabacum TaxID=4097 RepID=A0A1S4AHW6_TOBAC|nr:PREDICTED: uncharacterized protein LOC107797838 [Nicotiana tabacum]
MVIKLVVGGLTLSVISAYRPQADLDEELKKHFWEDLDAAVRGIPHNEKLFIGRNFNGHIGEMSRGYDDVHGRFSFRNEGGTSLLDFAIAFYLVAANLCFQKREDHLVTFQNIVAKTQIDYLLCKKSDNVLCTDCEVIPSE